VKLFLSDFRLGPLPMTATLSKSLCISNLDAGIAPFSRDLKYKYRSLTKNLDLKGNILYAFLSACLNIK
jgi:hypothetical protein